MLERKERTIVRPVVFIPAIILAAVVIWRVAIFVPAPQIQTEPHHHEHSFEPLVQSTGESAKTDTKLAASPKMNLNDIIRAARTWRPAYQSWSGKPTPDFTLTDITGKQHKLSDYRGKNVLIIFWATWCGPCLREIPHLIELRNTISEDKLAMLAISNENPALVKKFAADWKINYTVLLNQGYMTRPYSMVRAIPSSFFIDPEGKIKLAAEGMMSLSEIKAILPAE